MAAAEQLITENLAIWTSVVQAKSAAGRGKANKLELYGIKKLRELILELAVRGLLVPQDLNDESASKLLKKIAAKKALLVKDKKIKKPKALPSIEEDEKPFELSDGWEWARLQDLSEYIQRGKGPKYSDEGKVRVVSQKCIQWTGFSLELARHVDDSSLDKYQDERYLRNSDLLWNSTGTGTVGRINLISGIEPKTLVADSHVTVIRTLLEDPGFFHRYIASAGIQARMEPDNEDALVSGTTKQVELNSGTVIALPVPVPPSAEQARIVAKVDELMALCDQLEQQQEASITAHQTLVQTLLDALTTASERDGFTAAWARIADHFDTLFTTEGSIDQLKQTILQLAVMGKLVPQDPNDESASELLKKVAAEKAQLLKDGGIKKQKELPPIEDEEQAFDLPEGWRWCRLNELITLMDAGWSPACPPEPSPSDDVWGVLKTTAVQTLEYREGENKVLAAGKDPKPQYEVKAGDILITRAGPKNRVAISCLVHRTRPKLMISDKIIRFHLVEIGLSERYISLCLNAGATADYLDAAKSGMAESQMNISQDKLKAAPIPLAPLKEQRKVIETIDRLIECCDMLKTHINVAQDVQLQLADAMAEQVGVSAS